MRHVIAPLALVVAAVVGMPATGQPKKSEDNVKIAVKAEKPNGGKQVVSLTLEVAKPWHLYANPVDNKDLDSAATVVTFKSGGKTVKAEIKYPAGKVKKDAVIGDYKIYEDKVTVTATLDLAGVNAPVEAEIDLQTCDDKRCLAPSKVKVKVE